jgi:hypothetical protein
MIVLSPLLQAAFALPVVSSFFMVSLNGTIHISSLDYDVVVEGTTYLGNGSLVSVSPPRMSSTVDREAYTIQLADPSFNFGAMFDDGAIGMPVVVRLGAAGIDASVTVYSGRIGSYEYEVDTGDIGSVMANIVCTSPMSDLDLNRTYYCSKDYITKLSSTDTAYDAVFDGSGPINLRWGKV